MNLFFADHSYVFLFPIENEVIERRNRSTDLHCCSLDTLPLALSPLTLFPFNETCSSVDNIFAARDEIVLDIEQVLSAAEQILSAARSHKPRLTAEQIPFTDEQIRTTANKISAAVEEVLSTGDPILTADQTIRSSVEQM